ncbi:MAG: T9SS type A sorting domain-containing protein [Candidatus Marinimicrobia bacterium]|nr:T9SS type A sorting domain-containing protein [Candidatus Neomarinimicrobiota bacterium]
MAKNFIATFLIVCIAPVFATEPDLVLQKDITPDYIVYLTQKEATYLYQTTLSPTRGDNTLTMQAHMGLAILQAAWTHVNGDTLVADVEDLLNDAGDNAENIGVRIFDDILPILESGSRQEFFDKLIDFFESETYPDFRDSVGNYLDNIAYDFEEIGMSFENFAEKTDLLAEMLGENWDAVADGTAEFEYYVQLMGTEYEDTLFVFSRHFFNMIDTIQTMGEIMGDAFDEGFSYLDSIQNVPGGDILPGINNVRIGLNDLDELIDTLQVFLSDQPFAPFEFDLSGMDSLQTIIAELDTLLGGKEYPIGPEAEGKVIKPLAILENLTWNDGLYEVYEDYYRQGEPALFTFWGIFPNGITSDMHAMIHSDVVLNSNDTYEQFDARIHELQNEWLQGEILPDEHLGIALTQIFDLLTDEEFFGDIEQAFDFISEGRIDSLTYHFDWSSFDLHDKISDIRFHIDQYLNSDSPTNFVILVKENEDDLGSYEIGVNSEFSIVHLSVPQIAIATEMISLAIDGMSLIAEGLSNMYGELREVFVLDLDPTVLDFSQVESDSDFILILEQSNPDFLSLTPYGVQRFHEIGDMMEDAFEDLGIFFENMMNLMIAMKPYDDDFDMDIESMEFLMDTIAYSAWEIYEDFAFPDSTIIIGDERVNLSAWFDNPPQSFLMMWKNYVFGIDSTLGGMFPDRYKQTGTYRLPVLPKEFALYPVYPNPFNPVAKIEFDLPRAANVQLTIINLNGETVRELINQHMKPGKIIATWNAYEFPSGIYFSKLNVNGTTVTRKMTLMK